MAAPKRKYWVMNTGDNTRVGPFPNKKDAEKGRTVVRRVNPPRLISVVGEHEPYWNVAENFTAKSYNRRDYTGKPKAA